MQMSELNLFKSLPKRDKNPLVELRLQATDEDRLRLSRFGREYFDENTPLSYGGYRHDGRFAAPAKRILAHYQLNGLSRILDVGCAKGFLLYEFYKLGISGVYGIDISEYAISQVPEEIRDRCFGESAHDLSR